MNRGAKLIHRKRGGKKNRFLAQRIDLIIVKTNGKIVLWKFQCIKFDCAGKEWRHTSEQTSAVRDKSKTEKQLKI